MAEVGDSDKKITAAPSGHDREREHGSRLRGDAQPPPSAASQVFERSL
jgi:hypothetical protein